MKKLRLEILGMSYSQSQTGAYALILGAPDDNRRLPIIIGGPEAQSIAMHLENIAPVRPLTHDLFKNFADTFQVKITEIVINKFEEGIFHSMLVCEHLGSRVEVDSRTSDAVGLALRFNCPIFVYESIMDEAGIVMQDDPIGEDPEIIKSKPKKKKRAGKFDDMSDEQLADLLKAAIEKENYEEASRIRDEVERRKKA